MQEIPGFPADFTSAEPSATVRVDGVIVGFDSVTVESELESAMPSQVAAAGGAVVAATGQVAILPSPGVVVSSSHPWGGGAPVQGSTVTVEAGYAGALATQFTGYVDGISGAPKSVRVPAQMMDRVDALDKPISIEPLLAWWPSLTLGDTVPRRAGLGALYVTDRVLRHCGFYATPQLSGQPIFAAPMMGSAWPDVGTLSTARAHSDATLSVAFRPSAWGLACGNGSAVYSPDLSSNPGILDEPFQMVFCRSVRPESTSTATFTVWWGSVGLRVSSPAAGHVYAQHMSGATASTKAVLLAVDAEGADTFTVRWLPNGNVTIYASNGNNVTATAALPAAITTTAATKVDVVTPAGSIPWGGFQASFSTYQAHLFERTAHLTPPAFPYSLWAFPSINERSCADLLKEQAEAELAAMWLDEFGHFRWVNRNALTGAAPSGTLTSQEHLIDLPWEVPPKSVFSRVELTASKGTVTRRRAPNLLLAQGSSVTLGSMDDDNQFIEAPADEDWFMVSPPVRGITADMPTLKRGEGSYIGGVVVQDAVADRWANSTEMVQTWAHIGLQKWLLTTVVSVGTGQAVETQVLENASYGKYAGTDLFVLRGQARTRWEPVTFDGVEVGPVGAPVLRHDVGPWVQDDTELQEFTDWLAEHVTVSSPIIRDVPIVPDTRIQKGDVYWLKDTDAYRVRLKVLVMGISLTVSAGPPVSMEQTITCRIIEASRTSVTLGEHDAVWAGKTLALHDAFWAGSTLAQHDADPLAQ